MTSEPVLDPARPIIDPHLHLWDIPALPGLPQDAQTFLLPEVASTIADSGHAITHTVFVECHAMLRRDGPIALRTLGETEFANGMAAMSASGGYGPTRIAHRIVGNVDLRLGEAVRDVLDAHRAAAGERFRGVRMNMAFSEEGLFGGPCDPAVRHLLTSPQVRQGAAVLADMALSLDVWCLHSQLGELIDLADAVPDLIIVLDHLGTPERLGRWQARAAEARREWAASIAELALRPNVRIKLGGLGMDIGGPVSAATGAAISAKLAEIWRPWIETGIAEFGPGRAMFESNFPPDRAAASYRVVWNTFKRIVAGWSAAEQDRLFRRTAAETYRIALEDDRAQPN